MLRLKKAFTPTVKVNKKGCTFYKVQPFKFYESDYLAVRFPTDRPRGFLALRPSVFPSAAC